MKRNRKTISNTFPHYRSQQVSLLGLDLVSIMQRNCRVVLNLAKNRNRTKMALDEKMALDAGTLRCQPAEQKHADRFSSTKEMSINRHKGLLNRVVTLL